MRYIFIVLVYFLTTGCSTVYTLNNAEDGLLMKGSYCKNINYVFSGVEYNWCKLHGTPNPNPTPQNSLGGFEYIGVDALFSFVADVVVLPYTVYKQMSSKPIAVRSKKTRR
ncbi:MAG: hypothetical protein ACI9T9_001828 [Oleiphilaceae bacterium]|jgi:uncharacterized protein YceK